MAYKQVIHALKGLPGSGKSTFGKTLMESDPRLLRVNGDAFRLMLYGKPFDPYYEGVVHDIEQRAAKAILDDPTQYSLLMDNTNFHPEAIAFINTLSKEYSLPVKWHDFTHVPLTTCIKRDAARSNPVGPQVITAMYDRYIGAKGA